MNLWIREGPLKATPNSRLRENKNLIFAEITFDTASRTHFGMLGSLKPRIPRHGFIQSKNNFFKWFCFTIIFNYCFPNCSIFELVRLWVKFFPFPLWLCSICLCFQSLLFLPFLVTAPLFSRRDCNDTIPLRGSMTFSDSHICFALFLTSRCKRVNSPHGYEPMSKAYLNLITSYISKNLHLHEPETTARKGEKHEPKRRPFILHVAWHKSEATEVQKPRSAVLLCVWCQTV